MSQQTNRKWIREVRVGTLQLMITKAERALNPHKYRVSDEVKKRLRWLYILEREHPGNVSVASRAIGISRQWLSTIKSLFERSHHDPRSLEPESRAPHHTENRRRIPDSTARLIVQVRDSTPGWGKEKISRMMKRDHGIIVHPSTVNRALHDAGRIDPKISAENTRRWQQKKDRELAPILKVKHRPPTKLKDYAPGALIEKDMKLIPKTIGFAHPDKPRLGEHFYYQHTEIDSFTRMRTLEIVEESDSKTAAVAHGRSVSRFPFPVACENTDNGGENNKDFSLTLSNENVFHFYSNAGTPTDNPRVERSHRTDQDEFYSRGNSFRSLHDLQSRIKTWEHMYNAIRPHQALGQLTPIEFYELWRSNPNAAHAIREKYRIYLTRQRKRLAQARRLKRTEQVDALMRFIDAKLQKKTSLKVEKQALMNCQLCSWT